MYNWNQFRNLPKYKDLPVNEQARLFFIYEASESSVASSSSAGAGGGGSARSTYQQTVLIWSQLDGEQNWKYTIMDVDSGKAKGPFDTGVPVSASEYQNYIVQNKGYTLIFDNSGTYTILFIDPSGQLVGSVECSAYDGYSLYGKGTLILAAPEVYYFDGNNFVTYNFPGAVSSGLVNSWDDAMIDGSCVVNVYYPDHTSFRLINLTTNVELYTNSDSSKNIDFFHYDFGNFTVFLLQDDNTSQYLEFKIFSNKGALLQSVDLSSLNVSNRSWNFYSYNQFQFIFYTNNNADDYIMYNYNGDTNNLVVHNVPRGEYFYHEVEYNSVSVDDNYAFTPGSVVTYFYGEGYNSYSPFDNLTKSFAKAVYMFDGDTSYTEYSIVNAPIVDVYSVSGTPAVAGTFSSVVSTGGSGTASLFTVSSDGSNYTVSVTNGGHDYIMQEQLTISGALLGGTSPANDVTFGVYTKEVNFAFWPQTSDKSIITDVDMGDGNISQLVFLPTGTQSIVTLQSKTNLDYYDTESFGDKKFYAFFINDLGGYTTYKVTNYDGTLLATGPTMSGYVTNYRYQKDTLYIRNWNDDTCYYYNNTSNGIVQLDTFYSQRDYVFSTFPNGLDDGTMVLFNPVYYSGPSFRILRPNSITDDITLFASNSWGGGLGTQNFEYGYTDESGKVTIELYDFTGNLVNRVQTEYANVYQFNYADKRFFFILTDGSLPTAAYLVTPTKTAISGNIGSYNYTFNDYNWWY
jgi:hypothetical protein